MMGPEPRVLQTGREVPRGGGRTPCSLKYTSASLLRGPAAAGSSAAPSTISSSHDIAPSRDVPFFLSFFVSVAVYWISIAFPWCKKNLEKEQKEESVSSNFSFFPRTKAIVG